jgi:hypothetical protein
MPATYTGSAVVPEVVVIVVTTADVVTVVAPVNTVIAAAGMTASCDDKVLTSRGTFPIRIRSPGGEDFVVRAVGPRQVKTGGVR